MDVRIAQVWRWKVTVALVIVSTVGIGHLPALSATLPAKVDRKTETTTKSISAIWTSGAIAIGVQLIAGAIVKLSAKTNVIAGWGVGAIIRFAVLALYALVIVKALGLPSAAALVSLAAFFFVSTLLEPLLLKS